jgi:hypothetical protein
MLEASLIALLVLAGAAIGWVSLIVLLNLFKGQR